MERKTHHGYREHPSRLSASWQNRYSMSMSFSSTLAARTRRKGNVETNPHIDPEEDDKSISALQREKNKRKKLDYMTIFLSTIAVLLTLVVLDSTPFMKELKRQRHFRKVVNLIEEQRKSLSEQYKQLSSTINEEDLLKQKETVEYLKADISAKQKSIEKLNKKIAHHEIKQKDAFEHKYKIKTLNADLSEKQEKIKELHKMVNQLKNSFKGNKERFENVKEEMEKHKRALHNFCYDCAIKLGRKQYKGMTCGERLKFLVKRYRKDYDNEKLALIKDNPNCVRHSEA